MRAIVYVLVVALTVPAIGQTQDNKIEFYLLKSVKPNKTDLKGLRGEFQITREDLANTPFIKDEEILCYLRFNDTIKIKGQLVIQVRHQIKVRSSVAGSVNKLDMPLCCGRQFAVVLNGEIIYGGYFWSLLSSWGCDTITAFTLGDRIDILRKLPDYDENKESDPRDNEKLFTALKNSGRMK
jgi:hypothetical protein